MDAIACTKDGTPFTAALVDALAKPPHVGLVDEAGAALLARWVAAGAPSTRGGVHPTSFADPRSPSGHGAFLRARAYRPMTDAGDRDACATCHDGAGAGPSRTTTTAPGATSCATCHDEPGGAFACTTCHGARGRAFPPRDPCFHPDARRSDAHAAHAAPSASRSVPIDCGACHPSPAFGSLTAPHVDGVLSVWLDPGAAGLRSTWDERTKTCTGTCHARGGARPTPSWTDGTKATCNDCHASPPPAHYGGACTSCHREADATGTALVMPRLHVNGRVDLGDGSGACGACHGRGADPWPETGAHAAHASPRASRPVPCETCHEVPSANAHPVGRGGAVVRFAGLATSGARRAIWDPGTRSCAGTYCHEHAGGSATAPRWEDGPAAVASCGSCHASPPRLPHVQDTRCGSAGCHEALDVKKVHVDGKVDRLGP